MRVGAVFVIFALVVTVCRGFTEDLAEDLADASRFFLYGTCACVEHMSTGQSVATCQVDALRPEPNRFTYLGSNNCANGYVPVCGKVFTVCYCLCKLAPTNTATTAVSPTPGAVTTPAPRASPTTERFCQIGTNTGGTNTFSKISCKARDPCATNPTCFDVCTANVVNSETRNCFCENTLGDSMGEQCTTGQRCNSNGGCVDVCSRSPSITNNCVCPAGRRTTEACFCASLSGNAIQSCNAGQQCNSDGTCQNLPTPPTCSNSLVNMDCMCGSSICLVGDLCDITTVAGVSTSTCSPKCMQRVPLTRAPPPECACNGVLCPGTQTGTRDFQCIGTECLEACVTGTATATRCFCDETICTATETCDLAGTGSCTPPQAG